MKRMMAIVVTIIMLATLVSVPALAAKDETGNGCPSGPHYNLNIVGVPKDKTAPMDNNNGHRIFVPLGTKDVSKSTKIYLSEGDFAVLDANGTDGNGARFQLPNPDPEGDGTTWYSVFVRVLGQPGGKIQMTTCATDPITGEPVASDLTMVKVRRTGKGKQKFENVSAELLYIYAYVCVGYDANNNPIYEYMRVPLFSELLKDYLWKVDNNGCKLAQLRFYEVPTTVPEAEDVQP